MITTMTTTCDRCGEVNPADIHTCTPTAPSHEPVIGTKTWFDPTDGKVVTQHLHPSDVYAAQPAPVQEPPDDELTQALIERDEAENTADELAQAIAQITGEDIGEHTSANFPWRNALDAAENWLCHPPRAQPADEHEFKNFHRLLCERFGYTHDEIDWKRDQISLIEWIAKQTAQRQPLTDEWIRSMCKETWAFETVKQWVRIAEAAHGIKGEA